MSHQEEKRVAILVAGMHRSGTSAVSRVLNLVGCDLPKTLMKPHSDYNTVGFWESKPISDLNRNALLSIGSDWKDWRPFDSDWHASLKAGSFREEAQALLHQEFGDSRLFVLKDPRLCRLLPFWSEVLETFGAEPRIVLPIRNPLDVAMSLKRRDGIDVFCGYLIWLRYVLEAELESRNLRHAYLRYDTILSEPYAVMDRLGRDIDVSWPKSASGRAHAEIERFLSPELPHHQSDDAALPTDPVLSRWLGQCFELFNRWSHGEVCETDVALLDRIRSAFDEATPLFGPYVANCEQTIAQRDRRIEELSEAVVALNERTELLTRDIDSHSLTIEALLGSSGWRITAPLRLVREIVRLVFAGERADLRRIARTVYLRMPLPYSLKIRIKGILFRSIPFPFRHTAGGVAAASRGASPAYLERLRSFAMQGQLTKGWYAGRELRPEETMVGALPARHESFKISQNEHTRMGLARYKPDIFPAARQRKTMMVLHGLLCVTAQSTRFARFWRPVSPRTPPWRWPIVAASRS